MWWQAKILLCPSGSNIIVCLLMFLFFSYIKEGIWVKSGNDTNDGLIFAHAIPGFLNCDDEGNLPGCLYKFDDPNAQCIDGRNGISFTFLVINTDQISLSVWLGPLCSMCKEGYGLSFDLLSCHKNCSSWGGILAYVIVCECMPSCWLALILCINCMSILM